MVLPVCIAVAMVLLGIDLHGLISNAENLIAIGGLPYWVIRSGRRHREIDQPLTSINVEDRRANLQDPAPAKAASPVEELTKLADMLEKGLLTRDEFDLMKARLIGPQP